MGADYIPEQDGSAAVWMNWFSYYLAFKPEAYRTTPQYAEQLVAVAGAYSAAYMDAANPGSKSKSLVSAKNTARRAAERLIRPEAQRVRTDPQIPVELKVLIGLAPRRKRRREIPAPQSVPVLGVSASMSGVLTLRVNDSRSLRKARPVGAKGIYLYERITPLATIEARERGELTQENATEAYRFIGMFTRTPIRLAPSLSRHGDQVSYVARWVTVRGYESKLGREVSIRPPFNPMSGSAFSTNRDRRAVA